MARNEHPSNPVTFYDPVTDTHVAFDEDAALERTGPRTLHLTKFDGSDDCPTYAVLKDALRQSERQIVAAL